VDQKLILSYEKDAGVPYTDNLTGLYNHGFFQIILDKEVKRSRRTGEPFTLAFIDVDSFTLYNRKHGPAKADKILRQISRIIKENIREVDFAARFMGDVLAMIMINSRAEGAQIAIERIRKTVEERFDGTPTVTGSLVTFPEAGNNRENLLTSAVDALRKAKRRGKNRVYIFKEEEIQNSDDTPMVLVVDDDPKNVKMLEGHLEANNYVVLKAFSGEEALDVVRKTDVDLVLLDIMMPGMDGFEVCRRLKSVEATRLIPVIMITALDDLEDRIKGIESGADDFLTKPANREELLARTKSLVNVKKLNNKLTSIGNILFSLANAVEAKDRYTEGHIMRVANLAVALGRKLGLKESQIASLRLGGILHDVGKIGVPGKTLNKPGALNEEEIKEVQAHTTFGYRICMPLQQSLGQALDIIRHHHEKLDGSSYPDGLKGDEISVESRIMAVVDIFDALTSNRSYRKSLGKDAAFKVLREEAAEGKLDCHVVEELIDLIQKKDREKKLKIEGDRLRRIEPGNMKSGSAGEKSILVIEDDKKNMKLVRRILELEEHHVIEAADARDGIRIACNLHPALILMDIQLPGMDGLEATRIIKDDNLLKDIPVIALSSYAMESDKKKAREAGCAAYLTKPIDRKIFISTIEQYLR
jgi:putative two-component system response regulator